jgi:hypothetical protein
VRDQRRQRQRRSADAGRREGVVTLVVGAACDLQVDRLIVPGCGGDQLFDDGFPAGKVERIGQFDAIQRRLQARQVFVNPEGRRE